MAVQLAIFISLMIQGRNKFQTKLQKLPNLTFYLFQNKSQIFPYKTEVLPIELFHTSVLTFYLILKYYYEEQEPVHWTGSCSAF